MGKRTDHSDLQHVFPKETTGEILSSARNRWDFTIKEVADRLNLSTDIIRALEEDDYETLYGYTFVKGYVRSYAILLRLNPEEVIETITFEGEKSFAMPKAANTIKQTGGNGRKSSDNSGWRFKIMLLLLLTAVGFFGFSLWSKLDIARVSEFLKIPLSETAEKQVNDAVLLDETNDSQESSQEKNQKKPQEKNLIRIQ